MELPGPWIGYNGVTRRELLNLFNLLFVQEGLHIVTKLIHKRQLLPNIPEIKMPRNIFETDCLC